MSSDNEHTILNRVESSLTFMETLALLEFLKLEESKNPLLLLTPQNLATALEVSVPRAYAILKQLETKNLVTKYPRKGFLLTVRGEDTLRLFVHRHRVLETYFVAKLRMELEAACKEAARLALHSSEMLIAKMCEAIGQPVICPHGHEIPHVTVLSGSADEN